MKKIAGLECILLIDDDEITNYVNIRVIKQLDIDVSIKVHQTSAEALNYLRNMNKYSKDEYPRPGIIFLDINMPGMNGWDFVEQYKKLPEKQRAKTVITMLTSSSNPNDEKNANINSEINNFMRKPLTVEKLRNTINYYFSIS